MSVWGGIEAGGTKFVCAIGSGPNDIRAQIRYQTTQPEETLQRAIDFFGEYMHSTGETLAGIGLGAFGPLDLNPHSPTFGSITATPKPGWSNTALLQPLETAFRLPVLIDTDVNAAAIGEGTWGAGIGVDQFIYITIGTGIGGGIIVNGQPVHGLIHPEIGHLLLPHDRQQDPFPGACPFHDDCFEGLASGPAIEQRWGQKGHDIAVDHPGWALEALYIAKALHALILTISPQRIILGGGVMQNSHLFPMIRQELKQSLNDYVQAPEIIDQKADYIVPPALGSQAGVLGAIALAQRARLA